MPIASQLQRFVDDEMTHASAFASRVLAGTLQVLRDLKDSGGTISERTHYIELIAALQMQAELFQSAFIESLRSLLEEELKGGAGNFTPDLKPSFGGLQLMDESLVDVDIEISRAMHLIDTTAEWELRELQTYTSTLTGQSHVSAESNPFRPLVYATALWQAACAIVTAHVQRVTLLRLSSGVTAGLLKSTWSAATTRLGTQGIKPGVYRTVPMPTEGMARGAIGDESRPGTLSNLLSKMPIASDGLDVGGSAAMPQSHGRAMRMSAFQNPGQNPGQASTPPFFHNVNFEAALHQLNTSLQASTADDLSPFDPAASLLSHRAALVATTTDKTERQIIELMSRLFGAILSDDSFAPAFRRSIARLQVAALHIALQDVSMLETRDHDVWQLMDRLGEINAAYAQPEDTRHIVSQAFCQAVIDEIVSAPAPDAALFKRALNRIDGFLAEQLQIQLRAAKPSLSALELAERQAILEQRLTQRLTNQMANLRTSPGVRRFVTGAWAKVLAEAISRFGEDAEPTEMYLKTVDDLLWSLQIPDHPQSRQRLLGLLPGLLQRLRQGMELIALPKTEQQAILDELMTIHAEALRPGGRTATTPASPEEIVQRMRDELKTEASTLRPFSDSLIDLSSMETVPAEMLNTRNDTEDDESSRQVEKLRVAERVRLFIHGHWSPCQLLWRSDHGLFFLFAGDRPTRTHSITRRALERLSAAKLVLSLEPRPLFQRTVDQLMREVSEPVSSSSAG